MFEFVNKIFHVRWIYLIFGSYIYTESGSTLVIGKNVRIRKTKIHLQKGSTLIIGDNVSIINTVMALSNSQVSIGDNSILYKGDMPQKFKFTVSNSQVIIGKYNRIRAQRFWIRFGGKLECGDYINVNEYSEIRCDEYVKIGDFVGISYNVRIWDTNTHEFEPMEQRRKRWMEQYIKRDVSVKPNTKPVIIGSDTWIGEHSAILKGTMLGNGCIVGYGTTLSNACIKDRITVLNQIEIRKIPNKL